MSLSQPYSADFQPHATCEGMPFGMSSPMVRKIARDSADNLTIVKAEVARGVTRENSQDMASTATPADVCNCVFRYPSQSSWPGTVPTAPAAISLSPYFQSADARVIADRQAGNRHELRALKSVAFSRHTQSGTRGKSRCEFSRLRRSHVSPSVALRPVATRRLNRVSLAPVQVQARPLSQAATPKQQPLSAQQPTWPTARPIQNAATNLTSAPLRAQPMNRTIKAHLGLGGFLLPLSSQQACADHEPEGTFDVQ